MAVSSRCEWFACSFRQRHGREIKTYIFCCRSGLFLPICKLDQLRTWIGRGRQVAGMTAYLEWTDMLDVMALAIFTFVITLSVLAWAFPSQDAHEDIPPQKIKPVQHTSRYRGNTPSRSSSNESSNTSRCSSSSTVRATRHGSPTIRAMENVLQELERQDINLSWASLEQREHMLAIGNASNYVEPTAREARDCRDRGSPVASTSPGPRIKQPNAHQDKRAGMQLKQKSNDSPQASDSSQSTTSSSPVRGRIERTSSWSHQRPDTMSRRGLHTPRPRSAQLTAHHALNL